MRFPRVTGVVWRPFFAGLLAATGLTAGVLAILGWPADLLVVLLTWLAVASTVTFLAYAWDKRQARSGGRRVPEAALHALAFAGGTMGALAAMRLLRHKSAKASFRVVFLLLSAAQVLLLIGLVWWWYTAE